MRTAFIRSRPLISTLGLRRQSPLHLTGCFIAHHQNLFSKWSTSRSALLKQRSCRTSSTQAESYLLQHSIGCHSNYKLLSSKPLETRPSLVVQHRTSPLLSIHRHRFVNNVRFASTKAVAGISQTTRNESNKRVGEGQEPASEPSGQALDAIPQSSASLPSEHLKSRSNQSARFNNYMESLLNSLARLSQRLNIYTGTDYSGISALRSSIISQEKLVRARHNAVEAAKEAHTSAIEAQSASHKRVVQLLERKHSWSDGDLEHYMTMVRSEHTNEQAVQLAKDGLVDAERSLEEARVKLEKIERQQYHEEQIWSDTIRRNSTWVTFGLMGFNIVLLLASLVAIEPWRRKRLVKEIRTALDERSITSTSEHQSLDTVIPSEQAAVEKATPAVPYPLENAEADIPVPASAPPSETNNTDPRHTASATLEPEPYPQRSVPPFTFFAESWSATFVMWRAYWADLFSERRIVLARVDLTAATLEGAAAGAAFMGLMFVLLRPR